MPIILDLPYPPSVNHYWGQRGNHRFIGAKGKAFRLAVNEEAEGVVPIEGRVAIYVALFPPDRRKRDIDNVLKSLLDALEHAGCFTDGDHQVDEINIKRCEIIPGGGCNVILTSLK